ncbi:MAG: circadian clock KaiB family protein [FCB group bacterium]|jgi:circadian clock protein KaiB|nr:circadian clock KaiB family protein [FCB group bacterium]
MPHPAITGDYDALETALREGSRERYVLRLFVTGGTFISLRAISNIRRICEQYLKDNYELTIVDLRQQPEFCGKADLVAAPTLIKEAPAPAQRLVGDMSNTESVLAALGITIPRRESAS